MALAPVSHPDQHAQLMLDSVQCALRPDRNFRFAPIRLPRRNRDPQDVDFLRSHSLAPAAMSSLCIPDTATSTLGANSVVNAANDISCAPPLVSSLVASSTPRHAWHLLLHGQH